MGMKDEADVIEEYETLQHLHQWKINHLRADQFELTYSDQLRLSFGCQAFVPDVSSASLSLVHDIKSSGATEGSLDLVKSTSAQLLKSRSKLSLAQVRVYPIREYLFHMRAN
jgi:hypothetical protein